MLIREKKITKLPARVWVLLNFRGKKLTNYNIVYAINYYIRLIMPLKFEPRHCIRLVKTFEKLTENIRMNGGNLILLRFKL